MRDPLTVDFLDATKGHSVVLNFSTIPQWMFKTENPVGYPADPDQAAWDYEQGTELRDPTLKLTYQMTPKIKPEYYRRPCRPTSRPSIRTRLLR